MGEWSEDCRSSPGPEEPDPAAALHSLSGPWLGPGHAHIISIRQSSITPAPSPTGRPFRFPRRCPHPCHCVANILPRAHSHCAGDRSTGGVHSCARTSSGNPCTGVSRSLGCPPLAWGPAQGQVFKERGRSARWRPPMTHSAQAGVSSSGRLPPTLPSLQLCSMGMVGGDGSPSPVHPNPPPARGPP